jgi:hypothetical protein
MDLIIEVGNISLGSNNGKTGIVGSAIAVFSGSLFDDGANTDDGGNC